MQQINMHDFKKEFNDYCISFYNNIDGVYPIATEGEIKKAILFYLKDLPENVPQYDSVDRENIRNILELNYKPLK